MFCEDATLVVPVTFIIFLLSHEILTSEALVAAVHRKHATAPLYVITVIVPLYAG